MRHLPGIPQPTRSRRAVRAAAVALAVSVLTACGSSADGSAVEAPSGGAADAAPASAAESVERYVTDCVEQSVVRRPTSMTLSCADSGSTVDGLSWAQWGGPTAEATGTYSDNNCVPSCANGTVRRYPVRLQLRASGGGKDGHAYTEAVVTFAGSVPEGAKREETYKLAR